MGSITGPTGWRKFETCPDGEPNCVFPTIRYLIDFITGISDVFSGSAPRENDPGVDLNSFIRPVPPKESTLAHCACQLPASDDPASIAKHLASRQAGLA